MKRVRPEEFIKQQNGYNYDAKKFARAAAKEERPELESAIGLGKKIPAPERPKASTQAIRHAGGKTWRDDSLDLWPENDFRLFVGNLGNEVTDEIVSHAFASYASLAKAKVIREKFSNKSKGYGFVSFLDPYDCAKALREMNGKYIGNRPCKLQRSNWKDRTLKEVRKKEKKDSKTKKSWGITA
uniref:RRM domain-containing protein n=1 Tax=Aureoumbra lagunensis TaxID=44058 RepID=A0A7S3JN71_9STRA|mmetsp:Transcript_6041/g.8545  ORF Transcript_6041/g.8545 Transcript_6041/m.8545 type:complete len:184 (+) Transcript_6041:84-635(+)